MTYTRLVALPSLRKKKLRCHSSYLVIWNKFVVDFHQNFLNCFARGRNVDAIQMRDNTDERSDSMLVLQTLGRGLMRFTTLLIYVTGTRSNGCKNVVCIKQKGRILNGTHSRSLLTFIKISWIALHEEEMLTPYRCVIIRMNVPVHQKFWCSRGVPFRVQLAFQ